VDVTVEIENVTEDVSISAMEKTKKSVSSGVYDLRLFRNRQLVGVSTPRDKLAQVINDAPRLIAETKASGKLVDTSEDRAWREANDVKTIKDIKFDPKGTATFTFHNVRLPHIGKKQVEFSAYAFNADRVKSNTDRRTFELPLSVSSAQKKGRAYVLTIGVKDSDNPTYKSPYAANNARKMQEIVGARLKAEVGKRYAEVIQIPLISDADVDKKSNDASKEIIEGVSHYLRDAGTRLRSAFSSELRESRMFLQSNPKTL
jgi:hypothetical protein